MYGAKNYAEIKKKKVWVFQDVFNYCVIMLYFYFVFFFHCMLESIVLANDALVTCITMVLYITPL